MSDEEDSASRDHFPEDSVARDHYPVVCRIEELSEEDYKAIMNAEVGDLGYEPNADNTVIKELAEALEHAEYALDRAICFKHPSSSQKEIEKEAQAASKQALDKHAERIKQAKDKDNE